MQVLVYEYLTGGGLWSEPESVAARHALLAEGRGMVEAISSDLARVADMQLVQFRDERLHDTVRATGNVVAIRSQQEEREQLAYWSARVDGVLLIAPEQDDRLLERCQIVHDNCGTLISPDARFVRLTGDKHATAAELAAAKVPTPQAIRLTAHQLGELSPPSIPFVYPVVIKPAKGVGSLDTFRLDRSDQWSDVAHALNRPHTDWRLEQYCTGTPVSVAVLCGPRGHVVLPPCLQRISLDDRFRYLGGRYPLAADLVPRACQLARATLAALALTTGYIGIDMILSDDLATHEDVVLEVNPRLTTSYVGLRHASCSNLAEAMLAIGRGQSYPLFFRPGQVEFDCQGRADS